MIVIDTSVLIAIINHEPERDRLLRAITASEPCLLSAMTVFEANMVAYGRMRTAGTDRLNDILAAIDHQIIPFDEAQGRIALAAFQTYGKGIHAKARLNFGDCASYALAKSRGVPLLFKGADFVDTDVAVAAA